MKELNIKQMTKEAFVAQYNLTEEESQSYFAKGHPVSELANLMSQSEGVNYLLIEGQLYQAYDVAQTTEEQVPSVEQSDIEKIEQLNEAFRDALIHLREYMYHPNSSINSEKAKVVKREMEACIMQAKEVLNKHEIKDVETLKKLSKKHFIAEFLEGVCGSEIYYFEDHIDCGL